MPSRLGDQNTSHPIIHRLGQLSRLILCRAVQQFEINGRIRQQRHGLVKHLHTDDEPSVRPLDGFETATASLYVGHKFVF
jgi:hypothetical protein